MLDFTLEDIYLDSGSKNFRQIQKEKAFLTFLTESWSEHFLLTIQSLGLKERFA